MRGPGWRQNGSHHEHKSHNYPSLSLCCAAVSLHFRSPGISWVLPVGIQGGRALLPEQNLFLTAK